MAEFSFAPAEPGKTYKMVDAGPQNGRQLRPDESCGWCSARIGTDGVAASIPGFPFCVLHAPGGRFKRDLCQGGTAGD